MQSLQTKFATGVATVSMLASVFAPVAFAQDPSLEISGNGNKSDNSITVENEKKVDVEQKNVMLVGVEVDSSANSGGNSVSKNTGGTNDLETGKATSNVGVTVTGGHNVALVDDGCGCPEGTDVLVSGNGNKSKNKVKVDNEDKLYLDQTNFLGVGVGVLSGADSGNNKVKKNTGSGSTLTTKKAKSKVKVEVTGGSNVFNPPVAP
jgi:hypothetical protein